MKRWSLYLITFCLIVVLFVLAGWVFDIDFLKRPIPGLATMNPTTALCFLLCGGAVLFRYQNKKYVVWIAYVLLTLCFIIGILRCIGEFHPSFRQIDRILFIRAMETEELETFQNRMSFNGAFNFILAVFSIALFYTRTWLVLVSQVASVSIGIVAWFAIVGYAYRIPEFYGLLSYLPMAFHTAGCFILLSLSLLLFHPEVGIPKQLLSENQGGKFARILFPFLLICPFALGFLRLIAHWNKLISTEFGVALLVVGITMLFSIVVFISVVLLNKQDTRRKNQEMLLIQVNKKLEVGNEEIAMLNEEFLAANEELHSNNEELNMMNETLKIANEKITEQARIIVSQKDEQLNHALDSSDIIIWSIDLTNAGQSYVSRSVERMTTLPPEAFIANRGDWYKMIVPEDLPKRKTIRNELKEKGEVKARLRFYNSRGDIRWLDTQVRIIRDEQGNPLREEGIATDITSLKQSEAQLAQERNLLRSLIDNVPDYIFIKDLQRHHVLDNKANLKLIEEALAVERSNILDQKFFDDQKLEFGKDDLKVLMGNSIINKEEKIKTLTSDKILLTSKVPLRNLAGEIIGIIGICRDITEAKHQDDLLNRYRENLDIIFSATLEEILLLDHEGKVVLFNNALEKFIFDATGRIPVVGNYLWNTTSPDRPGVAKGLFRTAIGGQSVTTEAVMQTKAGSKVHELRYQPIFLNGEVKYVMLISLDITERKLQEKNIRESEANLRAIFDTTGDAFILLDPDFSIKAFNQSFKKNVAQWGGARLNKGMNILEIIPEERVEVFRNYLIRAKEGDIVEYETQSTTENKASWFQVIITPVRDDGQQIIGLCITSRDLTLRKESELEIKENEERFRAVIENSEDFFVIAEPDGHPTYISSNVVKVLGYSADELTQRPIDVIPESVENNYCKVMEKSLQRPGKLLPVSQCVRHKQGQLIWLEGTIINLRFLPGVRGLVSTFRDVTVKREKQRKINELNQSLSDFQHAINTSSIVSRADIKGTITFVNENFAAISGYTKQELIGQNHRLINSDYHPHSFWKEMWKTISNGKVWRQEVMNRAKDGSYYWVDTFVMPLFNERNKITQYLSIRNDVTHRKKAEREKNELVRQLVNQNNDLLQFSFIASHNLRGPVASMLGLVNLFRHQQLSEQAEHLVTLLDNSVNRLDIVIRDLSGILEMRSDEIHSKEWVQLEDIVLGIKSALQSQIADSNAEIRVEANVPAFYTIKSYFHSILYNLISNAIKYRSPNRNLTITITSYAGKEGNGIRIADNGIGIELEKFRDKIFKLYQRFHLEVEGKGLGLYMVKSQTQTLNGSIEVESQLDKGTVFTVIFPDPNSKVDGEVGKREWHAR